MRAKWTRYGPNARQTPNWEFVMSRISPTKTRKSSAAKSSAAESSAAKGSAAKGSAAKSSAAKGKNAAAKTKTIDSPAGQTVSLPRTGKPKTSAKASGRGARNETSGATGEGVLAALRHFAKNLPGAEEYVMVHHPAFRVGKKPFVIVGMEQDASTLSINWGPNMQAELLADPRFSRTPYIGQHGWVTVRYRECKNAEWKGMVEKSYRRVAGKQHLSKLDQ